MNLTSRRYHRSEIGRLYLASFMAQKTPGIIF